VAARAPSAPRRLLARLRDMMARGAASLPEFVHLLAGELVSEVCSIYVLRPGEVLLLVASEGLNPEAVGHTRLRLGEGLIGLCAATATVQNLPDVQNHPAFAYRPETGEDRYASLLAVPVRRAARILGVLAVQNRTPRLFTEDEVEVLETVAMVLAELLAAEAGAARVEPGFDRRLAARFAGAALVPGLAIGPVLPLGPLWQHGGDASPPRLLADDPEVERARLATAMGSMQAGIDELIAGAALSGAGLAEGAPDASREVLEAYRLIATDAGWMRRVQEAVRSGLTAEAAVHRVAGELHEGMRRVVDPYLRERMADLEDLAGRLLAALQGDRALPAVPAGTILLARRLGPAELLDWQARGIAGLALEEGSAHGHAAIIARALGLPMLAGTRGAVDAAQPGDLAILDADEAQLILRPEPEARAAYTRASVARSAQAARWEVLRARPAMTREGDRVRLLLNIGLPVELAQLEATGAEGIGLFRTEIAMLARGAVLDVAEQTALYARVLDAAAGRPVAFRTLDLGGDKLLPDAEAMSEANPAMGWRSLRVGLDRPAVLRRQLRALLRAADGRPLSVMFPMVATIGEFRAARALLRAEAALCARPPARLSVGTMLEVPALLWQLDGLLAEADFISVGTNDLLQFLFAADRGSPRLAQRYDVLAPPMLDLLASLVRRAASADVPLSLCGEAAGHPLEALTLAALGFTSLSMSAGGILPVKAALAALDLAALRTVLATIRRTGREEASLREPIAAWAREQGIPL
jgi:phosphotransferase system enzyme I (PtsP)